MIIEKDVCSLAIHLRERLSGTAVREVLQGISGLKVSRISMSLNHLPWISSLFEKYKVTYRLSKKSFRPIIEKDKWISKLELCDEKENDPHVSKSIYVSDTSQLVEDAMHFEEINDDENFGRLLGIPSCCRKFYLNNLEKAAETNNDFTYFSLGKSQDLEVNTNWCNILGQYFGYALISFSPCSFHCENAIASAKNSYSFLSKIDIDLANKMRDYCSYSGLYTKKSGLGLFKYSRVKNNSVNYSYESILNFNLSTDLLNFLNNGSSIQKKDSNFFEILDLEKTLLFKGEGSILLFGDIKYH
jgi:hypothetical protein